MTTKLGPLVHSFFIDHLQVVRALRPSSVRSYRDGIKLFLRFVAKDAGRRLSRLTLGDLTFDRAVAFLRYLREERRNQPRTRNQRLAILHSFFEYLAMREPEMLAVAQRVALIPATRVPPPETCFLERSEVEAIFARMPTRGRHAVRDRALLLFLYNTGARVQEVADLRCENLDLEGTPRVRLHGKGDKWRLCPLWTETAEQLRALAAMEGRIADPQAPVFMSQQGGALTRFGIYKIVRKHAGPLDRVHAGPGEMRVSPHVFRHTTAVHLLEAGVEVNVIRGWLGHVHPTTTNRYAEIGLRAKQAALEACTPPVQPDTGRHGKHVWRDDAALLDWLDSL